METNYLILLDYYAGLIIKIKLTEEEEKRVREQEEIRAQRDAVNQNVSELDTDSESIRAQLTELAVRQEKVRETYREKAAALEAQRVEFSNVSQKGDFLLENVKMRTPQGNNRPCSELLVTTRNIQ